LARRRPKTRARRHRWNVTKRRWLVLVALILPMLATVVVLGYPHGPDEGVLFGSMVAVVVSKVDIPAGTDMDQLIKDDQFRLIEVPKDAVVEAAVTSIDQLQDRRNTEAILAGELIRAGRLKIGVERRSLALVGMAMRIGA
jgi:Flp pilus assembly protein CpaB